MKKILTGALLLLMAATMAGCGGKSAQNDPTPAKPTTDKNIISTAQASELANKSLVVYFSHSGNTRELAQQIQQRTGSDILEIKTVTPYTTVYNDLTRQARRELDTGYKPEIQPLNVNIDQYNTIFIGSPNWRATIAPPVITFLSQNNMSNKNIVPFITHEGSGMGRSAAHIKELAPQANVLTGLAVRGGNVKNAQGDVDQWLNRLGLK